MKHKFYLITACVAALFIAAIPAFADYKIKQKMMVNGQTVETTILVKGSRQRSESGGTMGMGGDVATIEQCDLKRNVEVNDGKKLYFIEPFDDATGGGTTSGGGNSSNGKTTRGGTVTMTINITDTGERKQMFGLTARHLKTVMTMQASPNACTDADMRVETDGWYVDLPSFSCPIQPAKNPFVGMGGDGGCQDKFVSKQTGSGKLGFPLMETRTMKMGDDEDAVSLTQSVETVEFSTATLDAKMFDVPKDYTQAKSSQDLYGKPDMNQMKRGMNNGNDSMSSTKSNSTMNSNSISTNTKPATKKAGTIRIGVLMPSNKTSENVSPESLRSFITNRLTSGSTEAIALSSMQEASAMQCDYVLTVDVSKLKQSAAGKIGGMFGKVTGADTSGVQKYEAQIDYKLMTADGQTTAQNKSVQKAEGAEAAAEAAFSQAAPIISSAAAKKN
ncbi:MAG: hypothetical protein ACR2HG_00455 [Pyrinomonadaceae bacterium]